MKRNSVVFAFVALASCPGLLCAETIEWTFEFERDPSSGIPNEDPEPIVSGHLNVRLDTVNTGFPPVVRDDIAMAAWFVSDFTLFLNGVEYRPAASRTPPYVGGVGQTQIADAGETRDRISLDLDLEGGGSFTVQMEGLGLMPYYGFVSPATPFGIAPPPPNSLLYINSVQARMPDVRTLVGHVASWTASPIGLSLKAETVAGCKTLSGTVTIPTRAPVGGRTVNLSDTLLSASVPTSITVPEGVTTKSFIVKTTPVSVQETGSISVASGALANSQDLTVRPMGPASLTLSPTSVASGNSVAGKITLECKAGPGPVIVDLSSSNPAVANPVAANIVVPQALQSAVFTVSTGTALSKTYATISGSANGITKSKRLTVTPAASVSSSSLRFGSVTVGATSPTLNVLLYNKGAVAFSVNSISLTGSYASWFAQSHNCPANLAAGASCTIAVTFKPLAVGSKSAKLTITTGATSTPLSVSLSGTGI
jgi:hypothetical protein